jgi:RHS repeat-associated protein
VYRFSSKEYHAASGLYYYLYRWYDPQTQRWLNRDPLGEPGFELVRQAAEDIQSDGPNLYAFVRNNPINRFDPLGLATQDKIEEIKKAIEKAQQIRDILAAAQSGKGCACLDTATAAMCQCALNAFIKGNAQEMALCFCLPYPDVDGDCMRRAMKTTTAIIKAKEAAEKAKEAAEKAKEALEKAKTKLQAGF